MKLNKKKFIQGFFAPLIYSLLGLIVLATVFLPMLIMFIVGHDHFGYGVANMVWVSTLAGVIYAKE